MRQVPSSTCDQDTLKTWHTALSTAVPNPELKHYLSRQQDRLLPSFAEHYEKLRVLPRRMRRTLQRQWKRSLGCIALMLALGQAPVSAAVIKVTSTCTLIRAIVAANNATTATGHCTQGSVGADTVVLPAKTVVSLTTVNDTTYGPSALPTIRTPITILGNGSTIRRVASAPNFDIFSVGASGTLSLQKTTVSGGGSTQGHGVANHAGVVNISSSTISGNGGCGVKSIGTYQHGGSYNAGRVTIDNAVISGNGCGAQAISAESFVVKNSKLSQNKFDGAFADLYSPLRIVNCTISGNGKSGVASFTGSNPTIMNSTISGNHGSESNYGVTGTLGGGVYVGLEGGVFIVNSTISGNSATKGGGLYVFDEGGVEVDNTTITHNKAMRGGGMFVGSQTFTKLARTLISGNSATSAREVYINVDTNSVLTIGNFNLFGFSGNSGIVGFTPGSTDIVPAQPLGAILKPTLANNGGPTQTHALVPGSVAIDAISDGTCPPPTTDQRGIRRPRDGNGDGGPACDIGSVER